MVQVEAGNRNAVVAVDSSMDDTKHFERSRWPVDSASRGWTLTGCLCHAEISINSRKRMSSMRNVAADLTIYRTKWGLRRPAAKQVPEQDYLGEEIHAASLWATSFEESTFREKEPWKLRREDLLPHPI
eukprot:scaffold102_cov340-Pavlova_lutheri.AAC.29